MMPSMNMTAVAQALQLSYDGPELALGGLAIDSRRVRAGDLFVAIPGQRVDGHNFVQTAAAAGAAAAIVERPVESDIPTLQVESALDALSAVGARNRDAYQGELLAITGSCGKTSVKNLCASIFSRAAATIATAGNYNNEIGVPLTLSRLSGDTRFAIVEMGATRRGDVAHLCKLARPRVTTVLNAMEAHLDGFGSVADVADVKAEIYDGLPASGVGVISMDQPWAPMWKERVERSGAGSVTYSIDGTADVTAESVEDRGLAGTRFMLCRDGEQQFVELRLPGRHNLANALAAAAMATACELPLETIAVGLSQAKTEPGRLDAQTLSSGKVLIDDSYNANPGSVRAAIRLLAQTPGQRLLILGEMLELGENSERFHREMGELAAAQGIHGFIGVGEALATAVDAFGPGGRLFPDREALAPLLPALMDAADVILVKGSRGSAMESVLEGLRAASGETA